MQAWGTLKANFRSELAATTQKTSVVIFHPVWGFGYTTEPGITGANIDQLCEIAAGQTAANLYDIQYARFAHGEGPGEYYIVLADADDTIHFVQVVLGSSSVTGYLQLLGALGDDVAILLDGSGVEIARVVGGAVEISNPEKLVRQQICNLIRPFVAMMTSMLADHPDFRRAMQMSWAMNTILQNLCG